jgi:molybdopterin synthase sulfur carrier subunit
MSQAIGQDGAVLTIRYYAAARAAAGVSEETAVAATLSGLRRHLAEARGSRLEQVLGSASFLVDGLAWHDPEAPLPAGSTVDVLPPFAGG